MSKGQSFEEYLEKNPGIPLIPKENVDKIKIKLGKSHRKESDWDVIKNILMTHDLITASPLKRTRRVSDIQGVLYEEGVLIAFTNMNDCNKYLKSLYEDNRELGSVFNIKSLPFNELISIAEENRKNIFIDIQLEKNCMFMMYHYDKKYIEAVRLG